MRGWFALLAGWCRLPLRGGFDELDTQIVKLRKLRVISNPATDRDNKKNQ